MFFAVGLITENADAKVFLTINIHKGGRFHMRKNSISFATLVVVFLLSAVSYGQSGRSTVKGIVKDQQDNVVAGATVTLSNAERNFSRTQTTTENGYYTFTDLPPGTYQVDVEAPGFKKTAITS